MGRDVELSWLGECVLRARGGTPVTVVVQGEAGIGKSRLVTEAMGRLRDPKDVVGFGHGVDLAGGELPYGTAAELLHTLVRDAGLDAVRSAAGEFATTLGSLYPPLGSGVVELTGSGCCPRSTRPSRRWPATGWCGWWSRICIGSMRRPETCWPTWSGSPAVGSSSP